jgi:hypothetical protein
MQNDRNYDIIEVTIPSSGTQSNAFSLAGFALASVEIPAAFKGNLSVLQSNQNPGNGAPTYYPCKDDVSTGITQTIVGIQKPGVYALRPEFTVCRSLKLRATSAQTAAKTLYVFAKG